MEAGFELTDMDDAACVEYPVSKIQPKIKVTQKILINIARFLVWLWEKKWIPASAVLWISWLFRFEDERGLIVERCKACNRLTHRCCGYCHRGDCMEIRITDEMNSLVSSYRVDTKA